MDDMKIREKALQVLMSPAIEFETSGHSMEILGAGMRVLLPAVRMIRGQSFKAQAIEVIVEGVVDVCMGHCTVAGSIVEDLARMIERCQDGEELRDLSVQIRDLMFQFEPDASRVALTENEARVLHLLEGVERSR